MQRVHADTHLHRGTVQLLPSLRRLQLFKTRLIAVGIAVAVLNVGGWLWAFLVFNERPVLLGIALLVYGLGLRHGVDADHICAIDNVTRKLIQDKSRPVAVGFFFALGHSGLVLGVTVLTIIAAASLEQFQSYRAVGGAIGTGVSGLFLLLIASMNFVILRSIVKTYREVRSGALPATADVDVGLIAVGPLSRLFRPLFKLITKSWQMLPLGFLFGLSFETATEIAIFSLSAAQAAQGLPLETTIVLPILFAAGMTLVDTADGVLMTGAYEWATFNPMRKLYYNMGITLLSVVVALVIGMVQLIGLASQRYPIGTALTPIAAWVADRLNPIGITIVAVFALAWLLSALLQRAHIRDQISVAKLTSSSIRSCELRKEGVIGRRPLEIAAVRTLPGKKH